MKREIISFMVLMFTMIPAKAQITVMSYNIKYANEMDGGNSWSLRKDHLAGQMKFYEPDIFGVQEALHSQLEFLKDEL